jgi:hypothetical protein
MKVEEIAEAIAELPPDPISRHRAQEGVTSRLARSLARDLV